MRNIKAVFTKQILSYFRNIGMLGTPIAFLLIPFAIFLLTDPADDRGFILSQFVVMFIGISMIGTAAGFISEDRETMNLRFMGMAGVRPYQYLIATCVALLIISFFALILFAILGQYSGEILINFFAVSMLGAACSMLLGITLGLSKFAPFASLIGIILGVGPMFSQANEALANIFRFTFTQQITEALRGDMIIDVDTERVSWPLYGNLDSDLTSTFQILLINLAVILVAFLVFNIRVGLDGERIVKKTA